MFGGLFSKKSKKHHPSSSAMNVPKTSISFLGEVDGDINSIELLRLEVTKVLMRFPSISNAWLSNIQHSGEDEIRIALIVESNPFNNDIGHAIALKCSEIAPIDILPSGHISFESLKQLKSKSKNLYSKDYNLFSIALMVKHGENEHMPKNWEQGIQLYIIADKNVDLALNRAMAEAQIQKFQVLSVFQDEVLRIEPEKYWDDFVMERLASSKNQLPSQEDIDSLVKCGGLIRSICMQWIIDDSEQSFQ